MLTVETTRLARYAKPILEAPDRSRYWSTCENVDFLGGYAGLAGPGLERAGARPGIPGPVPDARPPAVAGAHSVDSKRFSLEVPMNADAHVIEPRPRQRTLPALLEDVRQARTVLRQARLKVAQSQGGSATMHTRAAQQHLAKALRSYEQALTARRLPVPHALRDEMRLYRRVLGPNLPEG